MVGARSMPLVSISGSTLQRLEMSHGSDTDAPLLLPSRSRVPPICKLSRLRRDSGLSRSRDLRATGIVFVVSTLRPGSAVTGGHEPDPPGFPSDCRASGDEKASPGPPLCP